MDKILDLIGQNPYVVTKLSQGEQLKTLAREFGVTTTVISNIKRKKSWGHLKSDSSVKS